MNIVVADRRYLYLGSLQCEQYCQFVAISTVFAFEILRTNRSSFKPTPNHPIQVSQPVAAKSHCCICETVNQWNCPTFHSYGFKVGRTIDVFNCSRKNMSYTLYDVAWSVVVCSVLGLPQFFHKDPITSRLSMVCSEKLGILWLIEFVVSDWQFVHWKEPAGCGICRTAVAVCSKALTATLQKIWRNQNNV